MLSEDEKFTPDEVEEQLERLSHAADGTFPQSLSNGRLVKHLQWVFRESREIDAHSVAHVWERLRLEHQETGMQPDEQPLVVLWRPQPQNRGLRRSRFYPWRRLLEGLAAVLVVAIVVSSIVVVLSMAHQESATGACAVNSSPQTATQTTAPGVYAAYDTMVYKLDAQTGKPAWQAHTRDRTQVLSTAPTVVDNSVYISPGNAVYALDARTGSVRWQKQWGNGGSNAQPVVRNNTVLLAASDGVLHAMKASTGEDVWQQPADQIIAGSPASSLSNVVYLMNSYNLQAVNIANGAEIWSMHVLDQKENPASFQVNEILVAGNGVYMSFSRYDGGGVFRAFNASDGKRLWSTDLESNYQFTNLQVLNNTAYLTATPLGSEKSSYEAAYNTQDGSRFWRFDVNGNIPDAPSINNCVLSFSTQNGSVYALDAGSGKKLWTYHADGDINLHAVNNGMVYVEIGDAHVQQNQHAMTDARMPFTPRYIVALDKQGMEARWYPLPQNMTLNQFVVGRDAIYLAGDSSMKTNAGVQAFHDLYALKGSDASQLWQQQIENVPASGLFTTVLPPR